MGPKRKIQKKPTPEIAGKTSGKQQKHTGRTADSTFLLEESDDMNCCDSTFVVECPNKLNMTYDMGCDNVDHNGRGTVATASSDTQAPSEIPVDLDCEDSNPLQSGINMFKKVQSQSELLKLKCQDKVEKADEKNETADQEGFGDKRGRDELANMDSEITKETQSVLQNIATYASESHEAEKATKRGRILKIEPEEKDDKSGKVDKFFVGKARKKGRPLKLESQESAQEEISPVVRNAENISHDDVADQREGVQLADVDSESTKETKQSLPQDVVTDVVKDHGVKKATKKGRPLKLKPREADDKMAEQVEKSSIVISDENKNISHDDVADKREGVQLADVDSESTKETEQNVVTDVVKDHKVKKATKKGRPLKLKPQEAEMAGEVEKSLFFVSSAENKRISHDDVADKRECVQLAEVDSESTKVNEHSVSQEVVTDVVKDQEPKKATKKGRPLKLKPQEADDKMAEQVEKSPIVISAENKNISHDDVADKREGVQLAEIDSESTKVTEHSASQEVLTDIVKDQEPKKATKKGRPLKLKPQEAEMAGQGEKSPIVSSAESKNIFHDDMADKREGVQLAEVDSESTKETERSVSQEVLTDVVKDQEAKKATRKGRRPKFKSEKDEHKSGKLGTVSVGRSTENEDLAQEDMGHQRGGDKLAGMESILTKEADASEDGEVKKTTKRGRTPKLKTPDVEDGEPFRKSGRLTASTARAGQQDGTATDSTARTPEARVISEETEVVHRKPRIAQNTSKKTGTKDNQLNAKSDANDDGTEDKAQVTDEDHAVTRKKVTTRGKGKKPVDVTCDSDPQQSSVTKTQTRKKGQEVKGPGNYEIKTEPAAIVEVLESDGTDRSETSRTSSRSKTSQKDPACASHEDSALKGAGNGKSSQKNANTRRKQKLDATGAIDTTEEENIVSKFEEIPKGTKRRGNTEKVKERTSVDKTGREITDNAVVEPTKKPKSSRDEELKPDELQESDSAGRKRRPGRKVPEDKESEEEPSADTGRDAAGEPRKKRGKVTQEVADFQEGKIKKRCLGLGTSGGFPAIGNKYLGGHTSIGGGLWKAVEEAVELEARAFGLFLKSQRQWSYKPLDDQTAEKFRKTLKEFDFSPHMVVPHGSYLLNCGSPKEETLRKSRESLIDDLQRCEKLGLAIYNFHPGSTCGEITVEECIDKIAESINLAHQETKYVVTVIENMSCQGHTIGGHFAELRGIIDLVKDKARMGVCLDTCHAFAAGFDIKTEEGYEEMMQDFDDIVGLKYLKAVHINDSKGGVGCHLDRHENIGKGAIGLEAFRRFMNDPRFDGLPFVLETPGLDYYREIKTLYSLVKQ